MKKQGFTLVELIVVVVMILVLASIIIPACNRYREGAKQASQSDEVIQPTRGEFTTTQFEQVLPVANAKQQSGTIVYMKELIVNENTEYWVYLGNKRWVQPSRDTYLKCHQGGPYPPKM